MSFDIDDVVLSQYSASPRIKSLILGFNDIIKPDEDIKLFYNNVLNILTAKNKGLDVWGKIVGIERTIKLTINEFGEEANEMVVLDDESYRELILIKAASNISKSNVENMNSLLSRLYEKRGEFYVVELKQPMHLRLIFDFDLTPLEFALVSRRDLPPKPAGVTYELYQGANADTFGFLGSDMEGFNVGVFDPYGVQNSYILK